MTPAAHRVLYKMQTGSVLYEAQGRLFFSAEYFLHTAVVKWLKSHGCIEPGPRTLDGGKTWVRTDDTVLDPPPILDRPLPDLKWFKTVEQRIDYVAGPLIKLPDTDKCMLWTTLQAPIMSLGGNRVSVSRKLFELRFGPLPEGARLRNKRCGLVFCVNWNHWTASEPLDPQNEQLAKLIMAVIRGEDEEAKAMLGEAPQQEEPENDIQSLMDHVENIYGAHQPNSFEDLWQYVSDVCTRDQLALAVAQIGGPVAARCNPNPNP